MRKKRLIKKSVFLFFVFIFFLTGFIGLFYIPYFRIKKISIQGNTTVATENLMAEALNYLGTKKYKILPNNNIFIFSKKELADKILEKFGRIEKVDINKTISGLVSIKTEERNNEAIFCPEQEKCFFIDDNGFAFEPAPNFSAGVYLVFFSESSSTPQILSQEQFKKIIDFKNLANSGNIKIKSIILKKDGNYQLNTDNGWYILLNEQNNTQAAYQNLKIALDQISEKTKNLSYLDLRFGNKVFYKFR